MDISKGKKIIDFNRDRKDKQVTGTLLCPNRSYLWKYSAIWQLGLCQDDSIQIFCFVGISAYEGQGIGGAFVSYEGDFLYAGKFRDSSGE